MPRHVGLLVPWANTVMEAELPAYTAGRAVWHVARLVPKNEGTRLDRGFIDGLLADIPRCLAELRALPLSATYLGCTSASFEQAMPTLDATGRSVDLVTAFGTLLEVARHYRWRTVCLVTPYEPSITKAEAEALERDGLRVSGAAGMNESDAFDAIDIERLVALAKQTIRPGAEGLLISCTNLHSREAIALLEGALGIPVYSSNRAMAFHADPQ